MKLPAFFSVLLFGLFLFLLFQGFREAQLRESRVDSLKAEVGTLQQKVDEKKKDLDYRNSASYVEKEARDQLSYSKPGEVIVVLPDVEAKQKKETIKQEENQSADSSDSASTPLPANPYWKQWRAVLFGN